MPVTEQVKLMPGFEAKLNKTGFVAFRLHYTADPEGWTPELIKAKRAALSGWGFRREMDIEFRAQAGQPVFELGWLDWQRQRLQEPVCRMDQDYQGLTETGAGRLWVYARAERGRRYALGMDVSEGVTASESTIVVLDCDHTDGPRQVAEMGDASITPADLGRFGAAVAKYFNNAVVCCVRKMHGITTLRSLIDAGCENLWHHRLQDRLVEEQAESLGWAKGEATDESLIGPLVDALHHQKFILRSEELLRQLGEYIYDVAGRVTHQRLAELNVALRHRHGDRAVGLALALQAARDVGAFLPYQEPEQGFIRSNITRMLGFPDARVARILMRGRK
jgi:hypothetical protein